MDVAFAGASALEIIRLVRTNPNLELISAAHVNLEEFASPRGSVSRLNFSALGLSVAPTQAHPATIRVPGAGQRKCVPTVRCLLFPTTMPRRTLLQLRHTSGSRLEEFDGYRVFLDCVPLACATIAASYQQLIRKGALSEVDAIVRLVELIMEFTGHYGRDPIDPNRGHVTENIVPVATVSEFQDFIAESSHVKGISLLTKALRYARNDSRSPMETCLWIMETFPAEYGFYGFSGAKLNAPLMPTASQRSLMQHKTLTPDLFWEKTRIAIEYQGFEEHASRGARYEDARRMNDYQVCGVRVFFVTFDMVRNVGKLDKLAKNLAAAMEQHGARGELERIKILLGDSAFQAQRARQLAHLLPPVGR